MAAQSELPRWRLFVAAPVPEPAARQLWTALASLRNRHPGARWAKLEQLHATLVFLGQTDPGELGRLESAVATAATHHRPFEVETDDAGGRVDDRRGGVCWLRIDRGGRQLAELALEADRRLGSGAYTAASPRPHITVARRIDQALLTDLRAVAPSLRASWVVDRIVVMRSHPDPGGSRYETLVSRLLTGASATP